MTENITPGVQAPEYAAVRHILSSPAIAARTAPHIGEDDFDWPALMGEAETMSGGGETLVRIANDLWEAKSAVGVWELPRRLDRSNFKRVIEALEMSRGDAVIGRAELLQHAA
jgi:hypothetical protein